MGVFLTVIASGIYPSFFRGLLRRQQSHARRLTDAVWAVVEGILLV